MAGADDGAVPLAHEDVVAVLEAVGARAVADALLALLELFEQAEIAWYCPRIAQDQRVRKDSVLGTDYTLCHRREEGEEQGDGESSSSSGAAESRTKESLTHRIQQAGSGSVFPPSATAASPATALSSIHRHTHTSPRILHITLPDTLDFVFLAPPATSITSRDVQERRKPLR